MKTILVTGATGFIASHLIPILHQQDCKIIAAVRSLPHFTLPASVNTIVVGNIDENTNWKEALKDVDIVIHLAARAHILQDNASNPEAEFIKVNTLGTSNLVQQSIQANVKHFLFVSSIGAVTTLSDEILTEQSVCQPDTPYGESKLQAENSLIELAKNSQMNWTILRPTLVYGQGNPGNMERLMKLIQRKLPLPFGAINNRRSFVYVGNLVDAIVTIITHPKAANQTFIISDGEDVSTAQLIRQIADCLELPCSLLPVPLILLKLIGSMGDGIEQVRQKPFILNRSTINRLSGSLWVDSSKLRHLLDWKPPYTFEQGLKQTLKTTQS
jgi:nucleoside-diphosphate-sugar epimerase